jgi:hypothetical protein
MPIEFRKNLAVFREVVSVEEAEPLLEWLQKKTAGKIDLAACSHLHPSSLQVLMACKATIHVWPKDDTLSLWLQSALKKPQKEK